MASETAPGPILSNTDNRSDSQTVRPSPDRLQGSQTPVAGETALGLIPSGTDNQSNSQTVIPSPLQSAAQVLPDVEASQNNSDIPDSDQRVSCKGSGLSLPTAETDSCNEPNTVVRWGQESHDNLVCISYIIISLLIFLAYISIC